QWRPIAPAILSEKIDRPAPSRAGAFGQPRNFSSLGSNPPTGLCKSPGCHSFAEHIVGLGGQKLAKPQDSPPSGQAPRQRTRRIPPPGRRYNAPSVLPEPHNDCQRPTAPPEPRPPMTREIVIRTATVESAQPLRPPRLA